MYTISGGRRLYKYEDGKHKLIKRDEVFQSPTIIVLIKPIKLKRHSKSIFIEKQLTFNQGVGDYKLINSRPRLEQIYIKLLILAFTAMTIGYILTVIDDNTNLDVSSYLILIFGGLWIILTIVFFIYRRYFISKYDQYARELIECSVSK